LAAGLAHIPPFQRVCITVTVIEGKEKNPRSVKEKQREGGEG